MTRSTVFSGELFPLSPAELPERTRTLVARSRSHLARLLATLAEIDGRRLYRRAGHPTLYSYVIRELDHDDEEACGRILAARAARRFPVLFEAIADGRLHLAAVNLLEPHLTDEWVDGLVAAAAHKTEGEIDKLLTKRFGRSSRPPA